jgi:hypothetical protein
VAREKSQRAPGKATWASQRQRIARELRAYGATLGIVTGIEGALGYSRFVNVMIILASLFIVFLFRRRTTLLVVTSLYAHSAFYAYAYCAAFGAIVLLIAFGAFLGGRNLGYTSGVREALASFNLPVRPLPPPRPRSAGDLNLDEYCRAEGPYTPYGPDSLAISVRLPDGRGATVPAISERDKRIIEQQLGTRSFLVCSSRIRPRTGSIARNDYVAFPVDKACQWQYPGQQVRAVGPRDRNDIDKWRCHLVSGPPATWGK